MNYFSIPGNPLGETEKESLISTVLSYGVYLIPVPICSKDTSVPSYIPELIPYYNILLLLESILRIPISIVSVPYLVVVVKTIYENVCVTISPLISYSKINSSLFINLPIP